MTVRRFDSATAWEAEIGYSRAVRRGRYVAVSGTTAMDGTRLVGEGDAGAQARFACEKIEAALEAVGAHVTDLLRVRLYVTDEADVPAVLEAFSEAYGAVRPAATLLVVGGFIDARLLVEIEADAVIDSDVEAAT